MQNIKKNINKDIKIVKTLINENKIDPYEGYMYISLLVSKNSKDPSTQTGACIVNNDLELISYGFNAAPKGFNINWTNDGEWVNTKIPYVFHAEMQAIFSGFKGKADLDNTIMFATLFPCNNCALGIYESGIRKLYYLSDKYHDREFTIAAKRLLDECEVSVPYEQIEFTEPYILSKIR